MTALRLYETVDALEQVTAWLAENEGELTPELEVLLDGAFADFAAKVEATGLQERRLRVEAAKIEGESKAVAAEAQRLAARAKARGADADRLLRYLARELERTGRDKVNGLLVTVQFDKKAPVLDGELDQDALAALEETRPDLVTVIPSQRKLDRAAALVAVKGGAAIKGLTVKTGRVLRVK